MIHHPPPLTRPFRLVTSRRPNVNASIPPSPFPLPRQPQNASSKRKCHPHVVISSLPTRCDQSIARSSFRCHNQLPHAIMSNLRSKGYHCIFVYIITSIYSKHLHAISTIEHMITCLVFHVSRLVFSLCFCLSFCDSNTFLVGLGLKRILVLPDMHQFNSYPPPQWFLTIPSMLT